MTWEARQVLVARFPVIGANAWNNDPSLVTIPLRTGPNVENISTDGATSLSFWEKQVVAECQAQIQYFSLG